MHPDDQEFTDYLDDSLDGVSEGRFEQHVAACDECKQKLARLVDVVTLVPDSLQTGRDSRQVSGSSGTDQAGVRKNRNSDLQPIEAAQASMGLRFLLVGEIDRGGMGVVYEGFDRELKREVAIKIAKNASGVTGDFRFHREAQIAAQLQHPGIVPVHEAGRLADGRQYIAMKLVHGTTLSRVLDDSETSEASKHFQVFSDICNTMAYAHSRNIIHRDLKPGNIMVGEFGETQIMDWGLAKEIGKSANGAANRNPAFGRPDSKFGVPPHIATGPNDSSVGNGSDLTAIAGTPDAPVASGKSMKFADMTNHGAILGTPAYMSPEQAKGERADKRTDVFSLGAILYEILVGKPPFDARSASGVLATTTESGFEVAFHELEKLDADSELKELVRSCLAPERNDRPTDAEEVSRFFNSYLSSREEKFEEARLASARSAERLLAQQKRNRQLLWSSTFIFLAALASAIAGFLYLSEKNASLERQAQVEREALRRTNQQEDHIRNSLASSRKLLTIAETRIGKEQVAGLQMAGKELEKASPFLNDSNSVQLRQEFRQFETQLRVETAFAVRREQQRSEEYDSLENILRLNEESFFPEDMRLCKWVDLLPKYADAYKKLGIEPGVISDMAVQRISRSEHKTQLVHGLYVWQRECALQLLMPELTSGAKVDIRKLRDWLIRLIKKCDTDSFRTRIRSLSLNRQIVGVADLARREKAVSSLLTVHAVATALNASGVPRDERIDFLLRAHQRFPNDFFVNWYLPIMSDGGEIRSEYALSCYALRPSNPAVLAALGAAFINEEKFGRAIEVLKKLTEIAPWYYIGQKNLAIAYDENDEPKKATAQYKVARKCIEDAKGMFQARIDYYQNSGDTKNAKNIEEFLANALTSSPPQPLPKSTSPFDKTTERQLKEEIEKTKLDIQRKPAYLPYHGRLGKHYTSLLSLYENAELQEELSKTLDAAIRDLRASSALDSTVSTSHERLSQICEKYGRFDVAIDSIKAAMAIHPKYGAFYGRLTRLHTAKCARLKRNLQYDQLSETVDAAIVDFSSIAANAGPKDTGAFKRVATFAEEHKRYKVSIDAWKKVAEMEPGYWPHKVKIGQLYLALGKQHKRNRHLQAADSAFEAAAEFFRAWQEGSPDAATPHEQLSEVLEQQEQYKSAMESLAKAIKMHPAYGPHHNRFADLCISWCRQLQSKDERADGITFLSASIELLEQLSPNHGSLGDLYATASEFHSDLGQFESAIELIKQSIKHQPGEQLLLQRLGRLYVRAGRPELALKTMQKALKITPDGESVIATTAEVHISLDRPADAETLIRKAQDRGINSTDMQLWLARALFALAEKDENLEFKKAEAESLMADLRQSSPAVPAGSNDIVGETAEVLPEN